MADRWPAAALTAPRGLTPSGPAALDVESAEIVRPSAASPLNIVHVLRAPLGGLFRHVVDLAEGQAARGHRVGLIVDSTTGGSRAEAAPRRWRRVWHSGSSVRRSAASLGPRILRRYAALPAGLGKPPPTCCTGTARRARL
jgi:hypothetical protein